MTDTNIDKQVADLIDAMQLDDTHALPNDSLPENDLFSKFSGENHEQVIGHVVGQWQVEKLLGTGGMSAVYEVSRLDDQIKQKGALKVISERFVYSSFKDRFYKERQILTDLNHPNIVKLLDAGVTKTGIPWYVMEHIVGQDIKTYATTEQLSHKQIIDLIVRVCDALICAHQFDVVHRDVKPSNVIISKDGQVKLFDFGIAHVIDEEQLNLTQTGVVIGTPGYMSPEQAKGLSNQINKSTDVFAVGVMLCELLTGNKPFLGEDVTEISYAIIHHEPVINSKGLAKDLLAIIYKCLQKKPVNRYADIESLKQDLIAFQHSKVVTAQRITWHYRLKKLMQRHPKSSAVISILLVSIFISIAYGVHQFYHNQKQLLFTEQVVNQANQISSEIQLTNLLPLHDVQPTYTRISSEADTLSERLKNNQSLAGGSAYTALGMAFLTMRNAKQAKELFNEAEKLDYQSTTLSRGLGLILSQEWRNEMKKNPDDETLGNLKRETFEPMMYHLNKAAEDQDFSYFIQGNIAYLEDDLDSAISDFDAAYQQNPGFYDALRVKSEVQLLDWQNKANISGYSSTLPLLQDSNNTLEKAILIGRSDPWNYVSLCANKSAEIQILAGTQQKKALTEEVKVAAQLCQDALVLDPKAKSPWTNLTTILLTGITFESNEKVKTEVYQQVLDSLDEAIRKHPKDERLYLSQVRPLMGLANLALANDSSPAAYFEYAIAQLEQVKKIDNQSSNRRMFNELGRVFYSQAQFEEKQQNNKQAISHYQKAIESYESSLAIQAQSSVVFNVATIESELHELYIKSENIAEAVQVLRQSIQRRAPITTEHLASYYPQMLELLVSMQKLQLLVNENDKENKALIDQFEASWQLACNYPDKTADQHIAVNQLREQWLKLSVQTTISKCQINQ